MVRAASGGWGDLVAPGATGLEHEFLGPQFAQVVGGLADAVVVLAGHGLHFGVELVNGELLGGNSQGAQRGFEELSSQAVGR
jgi:hypothetical protein